MAVFPPVLALKVIAPTIALVIPAARQVLQKMRLPDGKIEWTQQYGPCGTTSGFEF